MKNSVWQDFFSKFIDGYLLSDIERLNNLKEIKGPGNCGYFIVQGVLTGYDLLGSLVGEKWTGASNSNDFDFFIEKYMKTIDFDYFRLKKPLWDSIRNKLAHSYLTRDYILVYKGMGEKALVVQGDKLHIYCKNLVSDFKEAVSIVKLQIANDAILMARVENNIQLMLNRYSIESSDEKIIPTIRDLMSIVQRETFTNSIRSSGASMSTMPSGTTMSASVLGPQELKLLNRMNNKEE